MSHIVKCIADFDEGLRLRFTSSQPSDLPDQTSPTKPFHACKMRPQSPAQQARYNLFPRERNLPVLNRGNRLQDSDLQPSTTPVVDKDESQGKQNVAISLKSKISQHSIVRRRKVSVPELGPMTTVHEMPMDSPTIPGRPPIHERSISAPADNTRHFPQLPDDTFLFIDDDEEEQHGHGLETEAEVKPDQHTIPTKQLPPLIIPQTTVKPTQIIPRRPIGHARSESGPSHYSNISKGGHSPYLRTPYTPSQSNPDLSTPRTTTLNPASTTGLPTPISAPAADTIRFSPTPWEERSLATFTMNRSMTPQPSGSQRLVSQQGHRRDTSAPPSIMDRGRPRKRGDGSQGLLKNKRSDISLQESEHKAFVELPQGHRPRDVVATMPGEDLISIHRQAYSQAERFEVLQKADVDALSKELRRLDERAEYLRKTCTSLRAGRRNLQARICQFLRSARVAKFSYESMLKQEEALTELDASIDDWVAKLDMAENRRTRVRQKLLEHVAAASIISAPGGAHGAQEALHNASGIHSSSGFDDISTPPRSPTRYGPLFTARSSSNSPSPQRVVAQVPSTILEHPIIEEAEADSIYSTSLNRANVESIRVYAGNDIASLLVDVEQEISRLSQDIAMDIAAPSSPDLQRKLIHRQRSHELLSGWASPECTTSRTPKDDMMPPLDSPPAPPPPAKDYPRAYTPV